VKLLLKIRYDGTAYSGFQCQPNAPTVQATLTEKISDAFGFQCTVTGCSRTDAGVHALGYVAAVEPADEAVRGDGWCRIPAEKVHRAINICLPDDISVVGAALVPDSFHPRYDTVAKEYLYVIDDRVYPDPFMRGRAYRVKKTLSEDKLVLMNEAASRLTGKHDFSSFMASGSKVTDTVRTLYKLEVNRASDGCVNVIARGDGFLYNMVRILAGTLIDISLGKIDLLNVTDILEGRDRSRAGHTAPPYGLYLREVEYAEDIHFLAV